MSQTFANSIDGNPIYAERAEQDKNGLDIAQYYAKLADLAAISFSGDYDDLINKPQNLVQDASYVHTDNNFTNALKDKLDGIEAGAEVNVQPDWLQSDSASDDYIKNKPTISNVPAVTSTDDGKVLKASYSGGTGSYSWETAPSGLPASTSADEGKLLGVDANGDPEWQAAPTFTQEQADWNESDTNDPAYIKNKPTIPTVDQTYNASSANAQSGTAVAGAIAGVKQVPASTSADEGKVLKVDANGDPEWGTGAASQVQADWTESDTTDPSYIQNKPTEQALVAGQGITITEANNQVTIGCNVQAPVQDVTYGGSSVVNAQGVAEIPAPSYPVTDVTMDGTSVLNNGVAALTSEVEILAYGSTGAWAKFTAAITAGKSVFCRVNPSGNNYRFVALSYYNVSEGTAEFNFHRANPTKNYTTQNDELFVYSLSSSGTWATATKSVGIKSLAGVGLDKTVVNNDSITFFVKPKTNGGVNVDSNGVSVDVKEAPSDGKEYVRKNGAWVESSGAVETVLYSAGSGAGIDVHTANLVLSESVTNFDRVRFIYKSNDGYQHSMDLDPAASSLRIDLANIEPMTNGNTYVKAATLTSSDGITWTTNAGPTQWRYKSSDGTNQTWSASVSSIFIQKVVGIKNGVNLYNVDRGETVLYSGSRTASAALSETPVNFEYLRVTLQYNTSKPKAVVLVDPTLGTQVVTYVKGVNTWTTYLQLTLSASAITTDNSKSISFGEMNSGTPEIASVSLDSAEDMGSIVKVVGVNRIASN